MSQLAIVFACALATAACLGLALAALMRANALIRRQTAAIKRAGETITVLRNALSKQEQFALEQEDYVGLLEKIVNQGDVARVERGSLN